MRWRFLGGCAAGSLVLLLGLTSCAESDGGRDVASASGTTSPEAVASADTTGMSNYDRALKFAQCMREHGIEMEDPEPGGGLRIQVRGERAKIEAAQEACEKYSPFGENGGKADPQAGERMRKLAQCMRDNGVENFPDPDPQGGGIRLDKSVGDDPDFPAAQKKCEKEHMPPVTKKAVP